MRTFVTPLSKQAFLFLFFQDEEGSSVMGDIGPFRLGKPLILVCIVEGGDPTPQVSWLANEIVAPKGRFPKALNFLFKNEFEVKYFLRSPSSHFLKKY